ncbi:MAG: DNA-processing protein DprA [Oscillospiraceae bacterium]|nr:DNA-processing protein DprA [Oscillospiraceae bacterium]
MAETNTAEQLRWWVWLSMVFGAGNSRLIRYLRRYETPEAVYDAMQAGQIPDLPEGVQKLMTRHSLSEADSMVYFCRQHDIALLPMDAPDYPQMLLDLAVPPVLLTAQGDLSLLHAQLAVSVVGTRRPSPYTDRVTRTILRNLLQNPFTVVSGFAKGVDAIAHETALSCGAKTIAVLGCGINVNYPREHAELREQMMQSGNGLFVSEYLPGTQPFPANFPKRNRILSGLSVATAVMEGAARSGSLVTAQCANEQGRYIFAVPPADLFDPRYSGQIRLLRDGAVPLMSHRDLLMVCYEQFPQHLRLPDGDMPDSARAVFAGDPIVLMPEDAESPAETAQSPAETEAAAAEPAAPERRSAFLPPQPLPEPEPKPLPESEEGKAVVLFLREHGDTYADDIARAVDLNLSELLGLLTELELDGFVESLFGKQYRAV